MTFSNQVFKNSETGQLFDIFTRPVTDIIPSQDLTFDLGSSTKRWDFIYTNRIISSGSPVIDATISQSYLVGSDWGAIPFNNINFANNFDTNGETFTYTGSTALVKAEASAQYIRLNGDVNCGVSITVNNIPVTTGACRVNTSTNTNTARCQKIFTLNSGDIIIIKVGAETPGANLNNLTVSGFTAPALTFTLNEVLSN